MARGQKASGKDDRPGTASPAVGLAQFPVLGVKARPNQRAKQLVGRHGGGLLDDAIHQTPRLFAGPRWRCVVHRFRSHDRIQ